MSILELIHGSHVHIKRVNVLSNLLAAYIPQNSFVLDIGCRDGALVSSVAGLRRDLQIEGVDVMPSVSINVRKFDGLNLPFPDKSFDVAMFVDVLHHVGRLLELLRDAGHVARRKMIKDHLRQGFIAQTRLSMMDWMGNARHGVPLPYRYWTKVEWRMAFMDSGLVEEIFLSRLRLYSFPLQ